MTYIYRDEAGDLRFVRAPLGAKSGWKYTGGKRKRVHPERIDEPYEALGFVWVLAGLILLFGGAGWLMAK